jgi:hypothetical protein
MSNTVVFPEFVDFKSIGRFYREITVTEKCDGTNAQVYIEDDGQTMWVGSRTKWITPTDDNCGFAGWCSKNKEELLKLGAGHHFGEWAGKGVQKRYGNFLPEKRFYLFNAGRWVMSGQPKTEKQFYAPSCCYVVPILYQGIFCEAAIQNALNGLRTNGSVIAPGCMKPEGLVVYHSAADTYFKITCENDHMPKSMVPVHMN